jgi:TolB-like protein
MTYCKTVFPVLFFVMLTIALPCTIVKHDAPFSSMARATTPDTGVKLPATIAVLPFTIHASEDVAHIQQGVVHMLHSRLAWTDHVRVVPGRRIETLLNDRNEKDRNQLIRQVAEQTGSDFILDGSITRLAGSFSIDAMVYDMKNKQYMTFFEQSKDNDELIDKVARIAAGINKQVFDRSTTAWEKIEQERQARINELKRKNPEHLMQNPRWQNQEESPGWKIWKYLF